MNGNQELKNQKLALGAKPASIILDPGDDFWNWFAGFWEGEGSLVIVKKRKGTKRREVSLSVAQVDTKPLKHIQEKLGVGSINEKTTCFRWYVHSREYIIKIVEKLLPFLRFRNTEVSKKLKLLKKLQERSRRRTWLGEEDQFLVKNYPHLSIYELGRKLNRSYASIACRAWRLRLLGNAPVKITQRRWTLKEDKIILEKSSSMTDVEIGKILNRSQSSVEGRRFKLGIKKPKDFRRTRKN